MQNKMKYVLTAALGLVLLATSAIGAQDTKSLKKRVKEIKGDVQKITITVDGKDVVFEGKDAAKLFKKLKKGMKHSSVMAFTVPDVDVDFDDEFDIRKNVRVKVVGDDDDEGNFSVMVEDGEEFDFDAKDPEEGQKMMKVEKTDDGLVVTVKTNENGEVKTQKYEGEEAEKYLEEMKDDEDLLMEFDGDDDGNEFIWMGKGGKFSGHGKHMFLKKIGEGDDDEELHEVIIKKVKKEKKEEK